MTDGLKVVVQNPSERVLSCGAVGHIPCKPPGVVADRVITIIT